jgi:hypothetical protein
VNTFSCLHDVHERGPTNITSGFSLFSVQYNQTVTFEGVLSSFQEWNVMDDQRSILSVNMADRIMDENNKALLQDENSLILQNLVSSNSSDPTVLTKANETTASPSKPRNVLTSLTTTPRSANERRKTKTEKPSSSLMDQLDLLMGQDATTGTNQNTASPSKSPSRKKKPILDGAERDDSTRDSSSEYNEGLSSSERSTRARRNKVVGSSTTRSNTDMPNVPRSPQRKKKLRSPDDTLAVTDAASIENSLKLNASLSELPVLDTKHVDMCQTVEQNEVIPSPRRVKQPNTNNENITFDCKTMEALSERSTKSSSSATRVRTKKVASDNVMKSKTDAIAITGNYMDSTSERTSRSSTRSVKKQGTTSGAMDAAIKKKSSFRMEPALASPIATRTKLHVAEQLDTGPMLVASLDGESVVSENEDMATTPLLLRSCERSESLTQAVSKSAVLSEDILDRLNRSSLSDIEKSGIGVERSIKATIQKMRKKKNEALSSTLLCISSNAISEIPATQRDVECHQSIALDTEPFIESLHELTGESSKNVEQQLTGALNVEDDYFEEEVIDDEYDSEKLNSSSHLSMIAAEMDEAMTKIWAKFDEKVTKSTIDNSIAEHPKNDVAAPVDHSAALTQEISYNNDNSSNITFDVITQKPNDLPGLLIASIPTNTEVEVSEPTSNLPKSENMSEVSELLNTQKPDDTRLSSLVKLLVVDAWSNVIAKTISCLEEMTALCESDENAVTEMFQHGGHLVVIVLMRRYSDNAKVQIAALLTLQKAAECRNEFTDAIIALGALELIIVTMKNHDDNEDVVTAGCGALLNLTLPAKHANVFVFELHGIQTIAHVSAKFPTKIALQKYVLWMLQYFSYWENYKIQIVQQGGMQTLAKMIESFSSMATTATDIVVPHDGSSTNDNKAAIDSIVKSASATMKRLL